MLIVWRTAVTDVIFLFKLVFQWRSSGTRDSSHKPIKTFVLRIRFGIQRSNTEKNNDSYNSGEEYVNHKQKIDYVFKLYNKLAVQRKKAI